MYLLDTNIVSYIVSGRSAACRAKLLKIQEREQVAVSAITLAELSFGLEKVGAGTKRRASLEEFLERVRVLAWTRDDVEAYARLRTQMERTGGTLSTLDMLIAAHAVSVGAIMVTHDSAIKRTPGLKAVEDWATDL